MSGKYNQGVPDDSRLGRDKAWAKEVLTEARLLKVTKLSAIADRLGVSMAQLAIGWLLRVPQLTSVITGATRPSQLKQNLEASSVPDKLSGDVLEEIELVLGKDSPDDE